MKKLMLIVCLFTALSVCAKEKHAPLPSAIIEAKTVFIANEPGNAKFADRCYDELSKWGRYKIVDDPKNADLIFQITTEVRTVGYSHSANATQTSDTTAYASGTSTAIRKGTTYLRILDPKNGTALWSDSRSYGMFHSATRKIIQQLRERVEEQEKK